MAQTNQTTGAAANYARSLLELASEKQQAEPVGQELSEIRQIVVENPTFGSFLADPAIGEMERGETLRRIFEGRVSPLVMNFVQVLNSKGRLGNLVSIADAYDELLDELLGKVEVDVTVAHRLGSRERWTGRARGEQAEECGRSARERHHRTRARLSGAASMAGP